MKRTVIVVSTLAFLSLPIYFAVAATIETQSRISEVTVYPGAALISRVASVRLETGQHQVAFSDIIPELDDNSLRVSGSGSAEVKILGAQVKREYLTEKPAEKVKQLQDEIQKLTDELKGLEHSRSIIAEEKNFLDSIRLFADNQIPKDLVTRMPPVQELEDSFKFLDAKLKDIHAQSQDLDIKTRELNKKIEALNNELAQVSPGTNKLKRSIIVDLEVAKAGALDLTISYLVGGASWMPVYDARADFDKSEVELVSYGVVRQTSGDEWNDVEMSLSTAKPSISARMPYVEPWFLRPYELQALRKADMMVGAAFKSAVNAPAAQYEAFSPREKDKEAKLEAQLALSQAQEKGVSVIYRLARKADIKPDGSEHKLPISQQVLKADFEYSAYPRLSPLAYLGSRVTNAKELQLLGGRVNVFLAGDFVGVSGIDNIGPGEEFDLYLGADENVKIKKEEIQRKVDDVLIAGIPAPNRKVTSRNKLTVENYKNKKIRVNLFEAMPVSQDERIKVKLTDVSLEPKEKDWKDRKGIWHWTLELEPKAKQEIFYTYIVECPRDMQVEGL
ncbi:MAG: mucoidy inhibitor MuiA family protein [Deltaproteobacteria bacterium]